MAQDYESVGQASPSLTAVAAEHQGWDTDTPMSLGDAQTDPHYSFRGDRANTQILHQIVPTPEETFEQLWQQLRIDLEAV